MLYLTAMFIVCLTGGQPEVGGTWVLAGSGGFHGRTLGSFRGVSKAFSQPRSGLCRQIPVFSLIFLFYWLFDGFCLSGKRFRTSGNCFRTSFFHFRMSFLRFRTSGNDFLTSFLPFRRPENPFRTSSGAFRISGMSFRTSVFGFRTSSEPFRTSGNAFRKPFFTFLR